MCFSLCSFCFCFRFVLTQSTHTAATIGTTILGVDLSHTFGESEIDSLVNTITGVLNNAITINEFSLTDISLYGLATGSQSGTLKVDMSVAGYNIVATETVNLAFLQKTTAETVTALTSAVTSRLDAIRSVASTLTAFAEQVIKYFKSQISTTLCYTFGYQSISKTVCIDFAFW